MTRTLRLPEEHPLVREESVEKLSQIVELEETCSRPRKHPPALSAGGGAQMGSAAIEVQVLASYGCRIHPTA